MAPWSPQNRREELQQILETALGSANVYFQPPENIKLVYPCIIYSRDFESTRHADDQPYNTSQRYMVMVVDRNPDSLIPGKISTLRLCKFERAYTKDNLNHTVYNIYY